jgi:hydroxymethylpyrimidine pyrophosphatase-like HAD family hydrolase
MQALGETIDRVDRFAEKCNFANGGLVLDLDGTALLEREGKVFISSAVEKGVKAVHDLGRPVILNTLRFPISVLTTVGEAWYQIADVPILTVLLNGSVCGYIVRSNGKLEYEELIAFPLKQQEIEKILTGVSELLEAGISDLLLFFYTRNWREGESLWTPRAEKIEGLKQKYLSASRVFSGSLAELREELLKREICMACLFIDRPRDTLMAYQHSKQNSFFTEPGIDKASGLRATAAKLGFSLDDSVGAGDTEMDSFLSEVGLAVIVGKSQLAYQGKQATVRVADPQELGDLILRFVAKAAQRPA